MKITSFREFQRNLDSTIEGVVADRQPAVITRHGKPSVVLMALDDFAAYAHFAGTSGNDREGRLAALRETLNASIAAGGTATDADLDDDIEAGLPQ